MSHKLLLALVGTVITSTGCYSVVTEPARRADSLAEQGKLSDAEVTYEQAMGQSITQDEWDYIFEKRCDVRAKIIQRKLEQLDPATLTPDKLQDLRSYNRKCPQFDVFEGDIASLGRAWAEGQFVTKIDPLVQKGQVWQALLSAEPLTSELPANHARAAWIQEQRSKLAASQERQASQSKGPITQAMHRHLAAIAKGESKQNEAIELSERMFAIHREHVDPLQASQDCGSIALTWSTETSAGIPYSVLSPTLTECRVRAELVDVVETYTEMETRLVTVKKTVSVQVPVRKTTTYVYQSCDGFGCTTNNRIDQTSTSYETRQETIETQEMQTVAVEKTRPAKRIQGTVTATLSFTVTSKDSPSEPVTRIVPVTVGRQSGFLPNSTSPSQTNEFLAFEDYRSHLQEAVQQVLLEEAQTTALEIRDQSLERRSHEAIAANDISTARELMLTRWIFGSQLDEDDGAILDAIFPLRLSLASVNDIFLPAYSWMPDRVEADFFVLDPENRFHEGVIAYGYPFVLASLGAGYRTPETFPGQADRSSIDALLGFAFRFGFSTGPYNYGLGALIGGDITGRLGRRLGDDYQRLEPLPPSAQDEEEINVTLSTEFALPIALGYRSRNLGLFAGVRPTYFLSSVGHFFSEGPSVPWMGRLELRYWERYPMIIEGYWGDLANDHDVLGARLDFPMASNTWLTINAARFYLPANFEGLNERDTIFAPRATTDSLTVGISFGL